MITHKSSESHTRNNKPNLRVAQIEYRALNAALMYKILPGGCRNLQVLQLNPSHRQELPMRRELVWHQHLSSSIWKKFTCHQTLVYYLMDSFSLHILVQLLYNLHLHDVEIQNITLPQPELNNPINSHYFDQVIHYKEQWSHQFGCLVPGMFIFITSSKHNVSDINTSDHYDLILCSACRTCICIWLLMEMWTYTRAVTVTKEYWYHLRL